MYVEVTVDMVWSDHTYSEDFRQFAKTSDPNASVCN